MWFKEMGIDIDEMTPEQIIDRVAEIFKDDSISLSENQCYQLNFINDLAHGNNTLSEIDVNEKEKEGMSTDNDVDVEMNGKGVTDTKQIANEKIASDTQSNEEANVKKTLPQDESQIVNTPSTTNDSTNNQQTEVINSLAIIH